MNQKDFLEILDILEKNSTRNAPSDILHSAFNRTPYTILIATLLSLRTKDETTQESLKSYSKRKPNLKVAKEGPPKKKEWVKKISPFKIDLWKKNL